MANAHHCPLCEYAKAGNLDSIRGLCESPANPDIVNDPDSDSSNRTALIVAARHKQVEVVRELLRGSESCNRADPGLANSDGRTALMWAAYHGGEAGLEMASLLYEAGPAPNTPGFNEFVNMQKNAPDNRSAADYAYGKKNYGVLIPLLARGGKFRMQSEEVLRFVSYPLFEYVLEEVMEELDSGSPDTGSDTGHYQMIAEAILRGDGGANPVPVSDPAYGNEDVLINWAVLNRQGELAEQLVRHERPAVSADDASHFGSFVDKNGFASVDDAFFHAVFEEEDWVIVRVLVEMIDGLDVNLKNDAGYAPLHVAARNGRGDVIAALGTVPDLLASVTDSIGRTALHLAVSGDAVRALLELDGIGDVNRLAHPDRQLCIMRVFMAAGMRFRPLSLEGEIRIS